MISTHVQVGSYVAGRMFDSEPRTSADPREERWVGDSEEGARLWKVGEVELCETIYRARECARPVPSSPVMISVRPSLSLDLNPPGGHFLINVC